jgi:hypothetical protein
MSTGNFKALAILLSIVAANALAEPLRTVADTARNRTWVLGSDAVYLQDGIKQQRFELPGWVHASEGYACRPDLAVDAQGAAVVTSNVAPIVWRIDPRTAQVTQHELVLDADEGQEIGFTGLTFAADQGVFFAVSGTHGSLWRIDTLLRRAQKVPTSAPLRDGCGLAVERTKTRRTLVLCVRGLPQSRRAYLAPDQRSAYVRSEACLEQGADADIALIR